MVEGLTKEVISEVERDLRKYPDWILRIEASGLGITSKAYKDYETYDFKSLVESSTEYDEIVRRLFGNKKKLIELRYFQDATRWEVMKELQLRKNEYYRIRDSAILSFARVLGYIKLQKKSWTKTGQKPDIFVDNIQMSSYYYANPESGFRDEPL